MEAHYAIPPSWNAPVPFGKKPHAKLEMRGTSMIEPDCPNQWCRSAPDKTVKWSGPGEHGVWIAPTFERFPFEPKEVDWNEEL